MIANLKEEDIKKCLDIYNYYIENTTITLEEEPLSLASFKDRCLGILNKYPFIVYKEENKVLGYAYLSSFNTRSGYRYSADLSIYVDKNFRGKNIGTLLYKEIEKIAIDKGYKNIISLITGENMASVSFHLKHGFNKEGALKSIAIKFGREVDVIFMNKRINS